MSGGHRKHVDHCLNCGAPTPEAYCASCGQEAVDAAVTFRDQIAHFFEEVFGVESRLPQTLKLLLTRPGALTRAYNGGQRVRYVTPLKLYLFASVAFFVVFTFSASRANPQIAHDHASSRNGIGFSLDATGSGAPSARPSDGGDWKTAEEFDAWAAKPDNATKIPAFIQPHIRSLLGSPKGFLSALLDMLSKASMALVPIHALLLKLCYWRPRRFYGEHIVFSLHLHSFAYVAFGLASMVEIAASGAVSDVANAIVFFGGAAYSVAAARTAYGEGIVRSALKTAAVSLGYLIALTSVVVVAAGVTFFVN